MLRAEEVSPLSKAGDCGGVTTRRLLRLPASSDTTMHVSGCGCREPDRTYLLARSRHKPTNRQARA